MCETLRIGGKLSDAVGRKPFLMLGPAANILFGPLSFSDLGFGCPDDMRKAWKLPWCCICFYLKSYTFIQNFPPTKIRNSSNKRASIPHKNKRFPACEHRKKLFFSMFFVETFNPRNRWCHPKEMCMMGFICIHLLTWIRVPVDK